MSKMNQQEQKEIDLPSSAYVASRRQSRGPRGNTQGSFHGSNRSTLVERERANLVATIRGNITHALETRSRLEWRRLLALIAGVCQQSLCWGMIMTFGSILSFYTRRLLPDRSKSALALVGALPPFFVLGMSLLWGRLLDAGHYRKINILAGVSLTIGLTGLAFTGEDGDYKDGRYWQILLASIPIGIGQSCYFLAAPHTAKSWFPDRKGLAMGITNSGAAIGGTIWPLIFTSVTAAHSFRTGIATLAGISALLAIFIIVFAVPPSTFSHHPVSGIFHIHTWLPTRAFHSRTFLLHVSAICSLFLGVLSIPFFIEYWAQQRNLGRSETTTSSKFVTSPTTSKPPTVYLVMVLNASQFPGRLLGSTLSDKISARKLHAAVCMVATIIIPPFWLHASTYAHAAIFASLFGLTLGTMVSLPLNDVADLLGSGRGHLLGQYGGLVYTLASPFVMGGAVVSGVIVDRGSENMLAGWATGCFGLCALLILLSLLLQDDTWKFGTGSTGGDGVGDPKRDGGFEEHNVNPDRGITEV